MTGLSKTIKGAGLGFRREFREELPSTDLSPVSFFEIAPENWIGMGGSMARYLKQAEEHAPLVAHGLSLSIGSPAPLDEALVRSIREFMREHDVRCYTEHLSYCSDMGQLYDLLPIPFTGDAVHYVAGRISRVQDILGERIGMENVSYYAAPGQELSEIEFINAVIAESDCGLLLDVNNIYVNSINHGYDPETFLKQLPGDRVMYVHIAGHYDEAEDLKVDTHGADVIDPVWALLDKTYESFGVLPTLLERDFNFPPLETLLAEVRQIEHAQSRAGTSADAGHATN